MRSSTGARASRTSCPTFECLRVAARLALRFLSSDQAGSWFQHQEKPTMAGSVQRSPSPLRPGEPDNPGSAPETGLDLPAPPHLLPESSDFQR